MPSCKKEIQRSLFKLSFLSCSKTNGEVKPFMTADFLGTFFFNLFDCRFVFAPSCFTDTRLVRTPHYYGQFALSLGRGKPLYGHFLRPPQGPYLSGLTVQRMLNLQHQPDNKF